MKSDRETCCKNTSNDLKKRTEVVQTMLRSRFEISRSWTILLCSSVTKRNSKSILKPKILLPPNQEGTRIKGWIQSNVRFGPVSDIKVSNKYGRYSFEVQVQSFFQDQTVSRIRIVSGFDKLVREAMPIQEEEKASWKPAAKTRPILRPSSTSGWDFTPVEQRQRIDIEIQESKDPYCFQVSKFITRFHRHSQQVYREEDGGVHHDQVIDECKKKQSDNTGYVSDEMRKHFVNAPHWLINRWISVPAKGGGQKTWFQYCLNPNNPHRFLYLRAIQGHSGSTLNLALQDNVLLPESLTRSQSQNSCVLHCCQSGG